MIGSWHPHRIRGGALGALIGALTGLLAALVIDWLVSGDQNDLFWLPAAIVTGLFAGGMLGFLLAETWIGGQQDERDTAEAIAAVEHQHEQQHSTERPQ